MKAFERAFVASLESSLRKNPGLIHVVTGPRQVGKTTGVMQLLERHPGKGAVHYASADGELSRPASWILEEWTLARQKEKKVLLVLDEIQKVENWSETIKSLWDGRSPSDGDVRLILLGSSSLNVQRGLSESLAGRYFLHKVRHWAFQESRDACGLTFDQYLRFGGYPGSYPFIGNRVDWLRYVKESIVAPVIGKDILMNARVKSPALFKQCFDLAASYPAQEISYTKLLGQLQDRGNTDLVKYYLELLEGAFLIKQLFKYSGKKVVTRSSSPKILPLCPALFSIQVDADLNTEEEGRMFELVVGASLAQGPGELFYWREKNDEVDYVYQYGKRLIAVEVKSGRKKSTKGLMRFRERFPLAEPAVLTPENYAEYVEKL